MSKKPNLAAVVEAAGSIRRQPALPPASAVPVVSPATPTAKPRVRQSTRQVAAHFPEEVAWQLRELAAERRTTIQSLIAEALNDLFQKHGRPEIAPVERDRA
jgi:hypothetical protein